MKKVDHPNVRFFWAFGPTPYSGEGVSAYEDSKKIDMLQYCCVFTRKSHFCDENVKIYKVPLYSIAFPLLRWHDKLK